MGSGWAIAPMLGVPNVLEAVEFFCEQLGFDRPLQLYGPQDAPVYTIVRRNDIAVHLQIRSDAVFKLPRGEHDGDAYVTVDNADALRDEFAAKG